MKVLVSAYACSPNRGSEPGMGWRFVLELAKYHEVHVITEESEFKKPINSYIQTHQDVTDRIKFYYVERKHHELLRKFWPPSYYWFYRNWQRKVFNLASELDKLENFDLFHQLNMVGFREPGYLWKVDKPFVWGPIGGLENSPWRFLFRLGVRGLIFYSARNIFNSFQRRYSKRPRLAASHPRSRLIAATPGNKNLIRKYWGVESQVICEVGREHLPYTPSISRRAEGQPLKIVFSGQHTAGKNLKLLLHALRGLKFNFELHVLGQGKMTSSWKRLAREIGILDSCVWHGWVDRSIAISVMASCHVLCITSVSDLTATVTLEGLSLALPIICLDHCGFSHVVTPECGIKVPVDSPSQSIVCFSSALSRLYFDEPYRQRLAKGALARAEDFEWSNKGDELNSVYESIVDIGNKKK